MTFESIFIIALLILAAYGMHREKVKRLEGAIEALIGKNKALTDEVNTHRMAIRRKRLQHETEKLKPYSDELMARLNAMYPGYTFTCEVREENDRPMDNALFLIIKDPRGGKADFDEFKSIQNKAYEIASQFPIELDILDGDI